MQMAAFKAAGSTTLSAPVISSFLANPAIVRAGGAAILSWAVSNANSVAIAPISYSATSLSGSTNVTPSATTVYTLTATNASGTATASASVAVDATPPSVPQNLTLQSVTASMAALSWAASADTGGAGLAAYQVFRCQGQGCTPTVSIANATSTSYSDTGLSAATTYVYTVAAYDNVGNFSGMSNPVPVLTQAQPVPVISSFVAVPASIGAGQSTTLSWSTTNSTSLSLGPGIGDVSGTTSKIMNPSSTVTYTLTATNSFGSASKQATVTVGPDIIAPSVPASLTVTGTTASTVSLSWSASADNVAVVGYHVNRNGAQIASSSTTTFTDSGLSASATYAYSVSAYDAAGNSSAASAIVNATTTVQGGAITIGETSILSGNDSGNGNILIAQQATLSQQATIQSLSFYVTHGAGSLRLGLYASTSNGSLGAKVAETTVITPVVGWNTAAVTNPVSLPPGTYWLAYLASDNNLQFVVTQSGTAKVYSYAFGVMPATFSASANTQKAHWSFYGTLYGSAVLDTQAPSVPTKRRPARHTRLLFSNRSGLERFNR